MKYEIDLQSLFHSGLIAEIGNNRFATLLAIASFMNEQGERHPTQRQLAKCMGIHYNSVNKHVNSLLRFRFKGQPIITRKKISRGKGRVSSLYKIHILDQLKIVYERSNTRWKREDDIQPDSKVISVRDEDKMSRLLDILSEEGVYQ